MPRKARPWSGLLGRLHDRRASIGELRQLLPDGVDERVHEVAGSVA